ncbi:MAG: hypothetical protein LBU88_00300 [Treponema sp.]|jgi:hypothetical protein|nr:hypothetical protein [Treponema sp.]
MATLNMSDQMTALEIVKRANNPEAWRIIEIMSRTNEMLTDVPAYEANNGTTNTALVRKISPSGQTRIYNRGVGRTATQTKKVEDRIAMLADYSLVDASMVEHSGNVNAARMSEAQAIIEGMGLTQSELLIYGDGERDDEFDGLMARLNDPSNPCFIDMDGTGDELTSLFLCAIGKNQFHLIYPKGSNSVGVKHVDKGIETVRDGKNGEYEAYRSYFEAQFGIAVPNPESVIRIANIPKDATGDDIVDKVLEAKRKLPKGATTYAMYSNQGILIKIDKAARDKGNVVHTAADPWGKEITHIREIRCRQMDVILDTESRVA